MHKETEELCRNIPEPMRPHAMELAENLLFMEKKLKESRTGMAKMPIVISYTDSKGNTRVKANPAFDAYNSLMRSFTRTFSDLREVVGKGAQSSPTIVRFEKFQKTMKLVADD